MATIDETKQYLNRAYRLDRLIQLDADEIRRLETLAGCYGGFSTDERVQTSSSNTAKFTGFIDKAVDKSKELEGSMIEKEELLTEIRNTINELDDNLEIEILSYRYMQYKSFYDISLMINYSKSTIYKIHDQAIVKLSKILWQKERIGQNWTELETKVW